MARGLDFITNINERLQAFKLFSFLEVGIYGLEPTSGSDSAAPLMAFVKALLKGWLEVVIILISFHLIIKLIVYLYK